MNPPRNKGVYKALRDLADTIADPVFLTDKNGRVLFGNQPAGDLAGREPGNLAGVHAAELIRAEDAGEYTFEGAGEARGLGRLLTGYGKNSRVRYHRTQVGDQDVYALTVVLLDEGSDLAEILDTVPDIIYRLDEHGNIRYVNKAVERYGYTREELVGTNAFSLVHPDEREDVRFRLNERRTGERRTANVAFRVLPRDRDGRAPAGGEGHGSHPVMLLEAEGIYEGEASPENFRGTQGVARDITQMMRAEKALRQSEERYRALVENTDIGIALVDTSHRVLMANRAIRKIYRMGDDSPVGGRCHEVFEGRLEPCDDCPGRTALESGLAATREVWCRRRDGEELFARHKVFCVYDPDGRPAGYTKFVEDLTERVRESEEKARLEQQLQQARKMQAIGTLAGGIAHDFNNILGVIMSYGELCCKSAPQDRELVANLRQILDAAQRAKEMTHQILAFGRQQESERKPVDIPRVVGEATRLIRATMPSNIGIKTRFATESCVVEADPIQLHQVLINLCANAEHALEEHGGTLSISVRKTEVGPFDPLLGAGGEEGTYVELVVRDDGPGMTGEVRERIFEPYYTTKSLGKGTGLGLSVVHGIVESHGGIIHVDSEPGKGAAFHLLLPAVDTAMEMVQNDPPPPRGSGEHLLLVDDDKVLLAANRQMLESLGYRVTVATGAGEALALFEADPGTVDLVITDQTMPEFTGDVLARKLLDLRAGLPVILCTGYTECVSEEDALAMGLAGYVQKPYSMNELARRVHSVLNS
ncbi:MAG: PAS domain S-box protein [Desulfatibacillaceae bacterium]